MSKSLSSFVSGVLIGVFLATCGFAVFLRRQRQQGGRSDGAAVVLKLGHTQDTGHPVHQGMVRMRERLEALSGGTMTIDIYPSSVLGSDPQCIEQVQSGSLSMTKVSAAAVENFIPSMSVLSLPYLFRDDDHYWKVLEGPIGKDLLQRGETKFLHGLCYYDAGSRNLYTKDKPVRSPADLDGLKIRVMNSPTSMNMIKSIGGSPTPISFGELYSALAQGTVDGAENNLPSFSSSKHYEVCKHFSLNQHARIPDMLYISTKVWDNLREDQRRWLSLAAEESSVFQRELWNRETEAAKQLAQSEGVQFYQVDVEPFAREVQPMIDAISDPEVRSLISAIKEVR